MKYQVSQFFTVHNSYIEYITKDPAICQPAQVWGMPRSEIEGFAVGWNTEG